MSSDFECREVLVALAEVMPNDAALIALYRSAARRLSDFERAEAAGELMMFEHAGYWQCMDTYRDLVKLEEAWNGGRAPWRSW